MAKVSGPLMSMSASGKFGGALVFASRLGQNVVRQLVIPANPMSANQETARNMVRTAGAGQAFANDCVKKGGGRLVTDKAALTAVTPAGQTWNSTLVKGMIGVDALNYNAGAAIWTGLTALQKTAWDDAAAALVPAILAVAQKIAGGLPGTPLTAGNVFLQYTYGLYALGITTIPTATPPVYVV